jgi:fused signal recognition particle receptor
VAKLEAVLSGRKIDEELFEELEELMITHDVGVAASIRIMEELRREAREQKLSDSSALRPLLATLVARSFHAGEPLRLEQGRLNIFLVVGVNGVGKTTSIGKMAARFKGAGLKVMVAAGDTFRAAASAQLEIWAERAKVALVSHSEGADPAAVVYDAIHSARARNMDLLIIDTTGRLHNKSNLMQELGKISRIIEREAPGALQEVLLVVDATTGQNALSQAREFGQIVPLTGIVLTKLDGTAKGGIVIAISQEQKLPIKLIGVGEKIEDLRDFDPREFAQALFEE